MLLKKTVTENSLLVSYPGLNVLSPLKLVNQGFYVRLPTRACRTGYWGRWDLMDLKHRTTNLIAAEIWTVKVPNFILL